MRETVVVNHVESYAGPVKILHTLPIVPGWGLGWDLIKIHSMQVCYDIKYVRDTSANFRKKLWVEKKHVRFFLFCIFAIYISISPIPPGSPLLSVPNIIASPRPNPSIPRPSGNR